MNKKMYLFSFLTLALFGVSLGVNVNSSQLHEVKAAEDIDAQRIIANYEFVSNGNSAQNAFNLTSKGSGITYNNGAVTFDGNGILAEDCAKSDMFATHYVNSKITINFDIKLGASSSSIMIPYSLGKNGTTTWFMFYIPKNSSELWFSTSSVSGHSISNTDYVTPVGDKICDLSLNNFTNIVFSFNPTYSAAQIYANGNQKRAYSSFASTFMGSGWQFLGVGGYASGSSNSDVHTYSTFYCPFKGSIRNLRYYNSGVSWDETRQLCAFGKILVDDNNSYRINATSSEGSIKIYPNNEKAIDVTGWKIFPLFHDVYFSFTIGGDNYDLVYPLTSDLFDISSNTASIQLKRPTKLNVSFNYDYNISEVNNVSIDGSSYVPGTDVSDELDTTTHDLRFKFNIINPYTSFEGVYINEKEYLPDNYGFYTIKVTGSNEVDVRIQKKAYTVNYYHGDSLLGHSTFTYKGNEEVNYYSLFRSTFVGYYLDKELTIPFVSLDYLNPHNINLYAKYLVGNVSPYGKSAYQLYLDVHPDYTGDLNDWLSSLYGENGIDGITPHIDNGFWYIGDMPTGVKAESIDGQNGIDGKNAYEIAVINGYNGTLADWLNSLKGETGDKGITGDKGPTGLEGNTPYVGTNGNWWIGTEDTGVYAIGVDGNDGKTAYQIAIINGFTGTLEEWLLSLKGDKGPTGDKGEAGSDGVDGLTPTINATTQTWWIGDSDTHVRAFGNKESAYDIYCRVHPDFTGSVSDWLLILKGRDGTDGVDGKDGKDGTDGLSAYEIYCEVYKEYTGTEEEWLKSLKGSDGKDGKDGASMYELYLEVYPEYSGTYEEWIEMIDNKINNRENVTGNNTSGCNGSISTTLITFVASIISLSALLIIKRRGKYENKDF